jgi:hypothetical protein
MNFYCTTEHCFMSGMLFHKGVVSCTAHDCKDRTEPCSVNDLKSDVPKGMVDPTNDDFGAVCNCAVRYCLGRRSYMPSLVCRYIISLLPELTDKTLDCFERDIAERKRTGFDFGDSCDYETWDAFYKAVCTEIERRKKNVFA